MLQLDISWLGGRRILRKTVSANSIMSISDWLKGNTWTAASTPLKEEVTKLASQFSVFYLVGYWDPKTRVWQLADDAASASLKEARDFAKGMAKECTEMCPDLPPMVTRVWKVTQNRFPENEF
jgi:hypothetical protein